MKTGKFIEKMYQTEVHRIMNELRTHAPKIYKEEQEIIRLQNKLRICDSVVEKLLHISFSSDGSINIGVIRYGGGFQFTKNGELKERDMEFIKENLYSFHIDELRKTHPKRMGELLRQLAKKNMLPSVEEGSNQNTNRKWWKFWK